MGKKTKRRSTKTKARNNRISDASNQSLLAANSSPRAVESGRVDSHDIKDRQGKIEGAISTDQKTDPSSLKFDSESELEKLLDSGGREAVSVDYLMHLFRTKAYEEHQAIRHMILFFICTAMSNNLDACKKTTTPEDKKFLRDVIRNKDSLVPVCIVAHATLTLAEIVGVERNRADCLHLCQECLKLCNGLSEEDKCQILPFIKGGCTAGEYLIPVIEKAQFLLETGGCQGAMFLPKDKRKALLPGGQCDGCGVIRKDGEDPFMVCSRCNRSYYCSKACQIDNWKCHKKNCRKSGDFRVGDKVFLKETYSCFTIHAEVGEDRGDSDDRYWLVKSLKPGDSTKAIFPSAKLRMMQPSEVLLFQTIYQLQEKGITESQIEAMYFDQFAAKFGVDKK